ncbi:MAG: hypothetical protein JWM43_1633 [Acidobacteriaceae bacterium]|nr:hypothetical protein [Acidobacteriaceae bacterium]
MHSEAAVYSIGEQTLGLREAFSGSDLLWIPHFNAPFLYPGRILLTIHDIAPLAMPEILGNTVKRRYAKVLIERAVQRAVAILADSEFTASELQDRLHVKAEKITVSYPGIEASWPEAGTAHVEEDGKPYLLYVGNVKPNKNLSLLLRAFARAAKDIPYRLLLVGRLKGLGTGDEGVVRMAEAMGDRVRFAGAVSDAQLISMYAGASAFVLPSLYEGFGLPVLEAMRLGCPVLCSTAASLPEVAGDAAMYFDPHSEEQLAECLVRIQNTGIAEDLRRTGRDQARRFSFERCAEQSAALMNRWMENGK